MTGSRWKNLRSKANQLANNRSHEIVRAAITFLVEKHKKGVRGCTCEYCKALQEYIEIKIYIHKQTKYEHEQDNILHIDELDKLRKQLKNRKDSYL